MIHKAKDLSSDQRTAIESLLGRSMAEDEAVSIRATNPASCPEWLRESWESARELGLDMLSSDEIEAEICAARSVRRTNAQPVQR